MRLRKAWTGWLLGACVLGVAGVAAADALRAGSPSRLRSVHPYDRSRRGSEWAPRAAAGLPRRLAHRRRGRDLRAREARSRKRRPLHETGATSRDLWVAPEGALALVSAARRGSLYELWLAELGDSPRLLRPLGPARGEPSWASDETRVAWCTPGGTTRVSTWPRALSERWRDACAAFRSRRERADAPRPLRRRAFSGTARSCSTRETSRAASRPRPAASTCSAWLRTPTGCLRSAWRGWAEAPRRPSSSSGATGASSHRTRCRCGSCGGSRPSASCFASAPPGTSSRSASRGRPSVSWCSICAQGRVVRDMTPTRASPGRRTAAGLRQRRGTRS